MSNTLYTILLHNIEKYGLKPALFYESSEGNWTGISWKDMGIKIEDTAKALLEMQINTGDCIGIISQNMPEWTITDYAIQAVRAVSVPLFATTSVQQALFILNQTETKILFVGEQPEYDKALEIAKESRTLKKIVAFSSEIILSNEFDSAYFTDFCKTGNTPDNNILLKQRTNEGNPGDLLTVIFTSGTSGEPKGVMLHQSNLLFCLEIHQKRVILNNSDISLSFLPLCHIFERGWIFIVLSSGISNYYLKNPKEIIDKIQVIKPNLMCSVPRFFEKTYTGVLSAVENSSALKKKIFAWAIKIGNKKVEKLNSGKKLSLGLSLKYKIADLLVLKKGRSVLGGNIRYMPCAGASLSEEIVRFFHASGITILYGYGLTETTATVSCFTYTNFKFGSVGKIMPGLEVKTGENNELLVKGETVTAGYFNNPKATEEAFIDGWFRTGDAGHIDDDGNVFMTDRIKDLFKTSSGKYIAPQFSENILGNSPFIDQVALIGNEKKYVSALIVPAFDALSDYAAKNNIVYDNRSGLLKNEKIIQFFEEIINNLQKDLSPFQKVKKFTLLPVEFSIKGGELTHSLKMKRNAINEKYALEISMMYPG
jgi:long-chain acyl-CoA synthetase